MPRSARYENLDLLESVILPMANLRFTLEDILRNGRSIETKELLRGLHIVHKNAAAIHEHLIALYDPDRFGQPERMTLTVLRGLDAQISDGNMELEIAS